MAPVTAAAVAGLALAAVIFAITWPLIRWRRRTPERTVWCAGCGGELPVSKAVRIVDVPDDDDEAEMMGGTACMVEYHRRCAPPEVG